MKFKHVYLFGLASGVALVGLAAYLLSPENTKKATERIRKDGRKFLDELDEVLRETKTRMDEMKERFAHECKDPASEGNPDRQKS